ncbi:MAG TPA: lytic transglycosylase domain-containing protein [Candidatus Eremiobacteraceae bacterium]|nr:lytic transglycosylase domain-containing protein [Candidatus Eremiobacteraceae bacterium]
MYRTARALRRALGAAFIVCASTLAGCSGGGLFPDVGGPHSLPAAQFDRLVQGASSAHQLAPALVRAVISVESGGDPSAISSAGAMGLMQLMPGTASTYGVADAFEPSENVDGGCAYLHDLLGRYHGDLSLALAAYNAGPGAVDKYGGVPPYPETQSYVRNVTALYREATTPARTHR